MNRISASRFVKVAKALYIKVSVIFEGHNGETKQGTRPDSELHVAKAMRFYMQPNDEQKKCRITAGL